MWIFFHAASSQSHGVTSRGVLHADWSTPFYRWLRLCSENISLVCNVLCLSLLTFTNESYTHANTDVPSKSRYFCVPFLIHDRRLSPRALYTAVKSPPPLPLHPRLFNQPTLQTPDKNRPSPQRLLVTRFCVREVGTAGCFWQVENLWQSLVGSLALSTVTENRLYFK